jgi:hypothetical protein
MDPFRSSSKWAYAASSVTARRASYKAILWSGPSTEPDLVFRSIAAWSSRMMSGGTIGASLWIVKTSSRSRAERSGLIRRARSSPKLSRCQSPQS